MLQCNTARSHSNMRLLLPRTFVGLDAEEDVQVAVLAATAPGIALAAHPQPAAVVHAGRDAQVDLRQPTVLSMKFHRIYALLSYHRQRAQVSAANKLQMVVWGKSLMQLYS